MRTVRLLMMSVVAAGCLAIAQRAQAAELKIIASHSGQSNPTTEGFTATGTPSFGSPVVSGGVEAWKILDASTTAGLYYSNPLTMTAQQKAAMVAQGWHLKWIIEMITAPDSAGYANRGIELNVRVDNDNNPLTTTRRYNLQLGSIGTTARAFFFEAGTSNIPGAGVGTGFHTWELIKEPGPGNLARLYVDGMFIVASSGLDDVSGSALSFGSVTNPPVSEVNWAFVQFSLPEPASLTLLGLSSLVLRRRSRP